ncbi:FG-GAP-like repeat-containing protein, partial [Candidatus Binatia bacterium]|nr:FG-GAP-like repeat-containing protein [Candidatus Binatia bacterium]
GAVGDCDGDGRPDLYLTGGRHDVLYRNRGDGTFEDVTVAAGLGLPRGTRGAAFGDVDGDGDLDLFVTGWTRARHFLYVNDGGCIFTEEAAARGVAVDSAAFGRSASFGDYDRDGYLDLFVTELSASVLSPTVPTLTSHLFHNRGAAQPGFFDDVTVATGVALDAIAGTQDGTFPFTPIFSDFDADGWPDLAMVSDFAESRLFWNARNGRFTDGTVAAGVGTDEHGMGGVAGDFDGDGLLDLFVTSIHVAGNARATGNRLYRNLGSRHFEDITESAGVREGYWGWGTDAFDLDNDGDLDIVQTNGAGSGDDPFVGPELGPVDLSQFATDPVRLWRNDGDAAFTEISAASGLIDPGLGYGLMTFDYDADGDVDVLLLHDCCAPPKLFRNDGGNAGAWLDVELAGRCSQRQGVGARVTLNRTGGARPLVREMSASSTYLAQNGTTRVHFGLGTSPRSLKSVHVRWPSGAEQTVHRPDANALLRITEPADCRVPDPPGTPDAGQRTCMRKLVDAGARVGIASLAEVQGCIDDAARGRLPAGESARDCVAAGASAALAKARAQTIAAEARSCTGPDAEFGPKTAAAVNAAFTGLLRVDAIFGDDLDAALGSGANASCQRAVTRAAAQMARARILAFRDCVRDGLRAKVLRDAGDLDACLGSDVHGRIAKADAKSARTVAQACSATDLGTALPGECAGVTANDLGACVAARVACDACRAIDGAIDSARSCHPFVAGVAEPYCGRRPVTTQSIARQWDEEALDAIRIDLPRPPVHARNLFHLAVAMWDAWAAYDPVADGHLVRDEVTSADPARDREIAISFAAYRVLASRYARSVNAARTLAALRAKMEELGLDPGYASTAGDDPAAVGNRVGLGVIAATLGDGANESINYADPTYAPANDPLVVTRTEIAMDDPNRWQPLALAVSVTQNGIVLPSRVQVFVGPQWGSVTPFAIDFPSLVPGPPPRLHDPASDAEFKQQAVEVLRLASQLTPDDGAVIDISPGAFGNNPLGSNAGTGHPVNPVTGRPYPPQLVKRGDFGRVLAEFWADGPSSETPPGHWNTIANSVSDRLTEKRIGATGPVVDDLEWDVKLYLALDGALHDAAVACWGTKRVYDSVRPISMIRYMGGLGQSSDPGGPSYDPDGLPLVPGLIEVITPESSAPGERHASLAAHVGEIAVLSWPGEPAQPSTQYSGVRWVLATAWVPYQRKTFVTPPFAGYVSGHSTYSRAAAEVLERITGSPYFPGGLGEFVAPATSYLVFERGPSAEVRLQWATYDDAADQAGQSRLWGGIHIRADDFGGRVLGAEIGEQAWQAALRHYDGSLAP